MDTRVLAIAAALALALATQAPSVLAAPTVTAHVAATPLSSGTTQCDGVYEGAGKVVHVATGAICTLAAGATLTSGVRVEHGGSLVVEGATIGGGLDTTDPKAIQIGGSQRTVIKGGVQISGLEGGPSGGADNFICNASIGSFLIVNRSVAAAAPMVIGGKPDCQAGVSIGGNLEIFGNANAIDVSNSSGRLSWILTNNFAPLLVESNRLGADLMVSTNRSKVSVLSNRVHGTVTVNSNSRGAVVSANSAGRDLAVEGDVKVEVSANHAGRYATCAHNRPAATGAGNTARKSIRGCPAHQLPQAHARRRPIA